MGNEVCAIWVLDESTNKKLNDIRKALDLFGIEYSPIYGHITFSYISNVDVNEIIQYTKKFVTDKRAFHINCSALALLTTKCIACIPSFSAELYEYFKEYHQEYDSYCNVWTSASQGMWLPHISLYSSEKDDLGAIINEMSKKFIQFTGKVSRLELSIVNENDFNIVYSHDLRE